MTFALAGAPLARLGSPALARDLAVLPDRLADHLTLTLVALAAGVALSAPLAVAAVRVERLRWPVLTAAGVIQTIPGLALLALMVPAFVLAGRITGTRLSAFGFWPAVIALTLYAILPVLRNTVTGILGVDPALVEAAEGLGMTPGQVLRKVQLPLAAPVILAGIRTASVWTVGIATLSTPVGQTSLGNYIFSGLQTRNWTSVVVGCVAAAALAIALDATLALLESAAARRSRLRAALAGLCLVAFAGAAALPHLGTAAPARPVRIGAKNFTEQYVLADLMARALHRRGFATVEKADLGSTVIFDALAHGDLDVYVDYTGTLWANELGRHDVAFPDAVYRAVARWAKAQHGITALGRLGFENAYALAMRQDRAAALGVATLTDLAPLAPRLTIGSDYEFFSRPEWTRVKRLYGLRFRKKVTFDPTFMYRAVVQGDVDVITAFTSDGRIAADHLTVLGDPRHAFPPYDAVILVGRRAARRPGLLDALRPLVGALDVRAMRAANARVDLDHETPGAVAAGLARRILGPAPGPGGKK